MTFIWVNRQRLLGFLVIFVIVASRPNVFADEPVKGNDGQYVNIQCIDGQSIDLQTARLSQGGLCVAKPKPGGVVVSSITLFGQKSIAAKSGEFVFGLGRDAAHKLTLDIELASGERVQQTLSVTQRRYQTQRIDGVDKKYVSPSKNVLTRIRTDAAAVRAARAKRSDLVDFLQSGFIRPAVGPITGVYGSQRIFNGVPKRPHFGLDIAGPVGTPVIAPAAGVVTLAHADMYYSGGTLVIDHGQGISSTFLHLDKMHVAVGQKVVQGERIADIGNTGRVTGPHLDWRINWFDQRLDPQLLLASESDLSQ